MAMAHREFDSFEPREIHTKAGMVFARIGGVGPPVLLLHGFPETHQMWAPIAGALAANFTVIAADLPGYGRSACPPDTHDHAAMSKRALAATLVAAMEALGHDRFAIAGHDRGGRVAYRAALDFPAIVSRIAVLDIVPTAEVWARADARLALAFWPFSLLAQPAPLPERLIAADPRAIVENALTEWGSPPETFSSESRADYISALCDTAHIHAICEEYRAAASLDRNHDLADLTAGRRIACPVLALWSATSGLATWYSDVGGPLGLWRRWADDVRGQPIQGGHFFPEEHPDLTAQFLKDFMSANP